MIEPSNAPGSSNELDRDGLPSVPWSRVERFVGQLAHDVRNNLNSLELQLTFLGEIVADPEAAEEVKRIRGTVTGITRQLQALRTATGSALAHSLDYPARDFFEDLQERFDRLHPEAKHRVKWNTPVPTSVLIAVDPDLTLNALLEILHNSLHFAEPGSQIDVSTSAAEAKVAFTVRETQGQPPVVSSADWGRQPLFSTRRGAYGLGLFRARRSIEGQRGTLEAAYDVTERALVTIVTLPTAV